MDDYRTDLDNNSAKSRPQTGREIRFLSICRKNRIFCKQFLKKALASSLEGQILAILNILKKPERSFNFLQNDANRDLLSLFV